MEDARDIILFVLAIFIGVVLLMVAIFGIVYGISAWVDSTWECPPGTAVVYGDMGFKSACYSIPPVNVNLGR